MMDAANHAAQVRTRKMEEALESGINDTLISRLVEHFYETVRNDDMLGPIFAAKISDWPRHLARMKDFWASIMLESGRFSGNPMAKHIAVGALDTDHFVRWQALWNQALAQVAPNAQVEERFSAAARRIGESLLTGIQIERGGLAAVSKRAAG